MATRSLQKIVIIGVTLEFALVATYCLWAHFRTPQHPFNFTIVTSCYGLIISLPIVILNIILFFSSYRQIKYLESSLRFINNVVRPFVDELNITAAIIISIAAGIGEELFFRGILLSEFGLVISSLLFSFLHFGSAVKEFKFMAFLYFLIGMYFSYALKYADSLWALCLAHASYDFLVIVFMKRYWHNK